MSLPSNSTVPAVGAAMFTVNRVQAASVVVSKQHLAVAEPQAVVINSGVANAATGERGELDALATAAEAGRLLFGAFPIDFPLDVTVVRSWADAH